MLKFGILTTLLSIAFTALFTAESFNMKAIRESHTALVGAGRHAVVVGATSGIGRASAMRLGEAGYSVTAVGRSATRGASLLDEMQSVEGGVHSFVKCDAFDLKNIKSCAADIAKKAETGVDVLVVSQGMGSIQTFTPTVDGNDEKLTLHWWGRAAFINELLPLLRKGGDSKVISVLSGGVHSPYAKMKEDPELKNHYSVPNAANFAGFYNDLGMDAFSQREENRGVSFVHAAPGFVNTNWGTEMPFYIKGPIRLLQPMLGKSAALCAEYMLDPIWSSQAELKRKWGMEKNKNMVMVMGEKSEVKSVTKEHSEENVSFVWETTKEVLGRAGIIL